MEAPDINIRNLTPSDGPDPFRWPIELAGRGLAPGSVDVPGYAGPPPCGVVALQTFEKQFGKTVRTESNILSFAAASDGGMKSNEIQSVLAKDGLHMTKKQVADSADFVALAAAGKVLLFFRYVPAIDSKGRPTGMPVGHWIAAIPLNDAANNYRLYNYDGTGKNTVESPSTIIGPTGNGPQHSPTGASGNIWIIAP